MPFLRIAIPATAAVLAAALSSGAYAASTTRTPSAMTVRNEAGGGHALSAVLPNVSSRATAFRAGVLDLRGYFDAAPRLLGGLRSKDGAVTIALFEKTLKHAPVRGLIVTRSASSTSTVTCLFDRADRFESTLPAMVADLTARGQLPSASRTRTAQPAVATNGSSLERRWWAAAQRRTSVALSTLDFADHSASIGVASGFSPNLAQVRQFTAKGRDDAFIRIAVSIPLREPGNPNNAIGYPAAPYAPDVATAWLAGRRAFMASVAAPEERLTVESAQGLRVAGSQRTQVLFGTGVQFGKRMAYSAIVTTNAPQRGIWSLAFSILWAPADAIEADVPKSFAMAASYRANQGVVSSEMSAIDRANTQREQDFGRAIVAPNTAARLAQQQRFDPGMQQSTQGRTYISQQGPHTTRACKARCTSMRMVRTARCT